MINSQINSQVDKLNYLFDKVDDIEDKEMKSEWANYLCVRVYGLLENVVQEICHEYSKDRSNKKVSNFIYENLDNFNSATISNIASVAGKFSKDWHDDVYDIDDELKSAVKSIVSIRHNIAHGGRGSLSFHEVDRYYERVKKFIIHLDQIFSD